MKTPNTLHVTKCSIGDCDEDALVTVPTPGDKPLGYCGGHIGQLHKVGLIQGLTETQWRAILASTQRRQGGNSNGTRNLHSGQAA